MVRLSVRMERSVVVRAKVADPGHECFVHVLEGLPVFWRAKASTHDEDKMGLASELAEM